MTTLIYCVITAIVSSVLTLIFCYRVLYLDHLVKVAQKEYQEKDKEIESLNKDYHNIARAMSSLLKVFRNVVDKKCFDENDQKYFENLEKYLFEFMQTNKEEKTRRFICVWDDRPSSTIEGPDFSTAFNSNYLPFEFDQLIHYYEDTSGETK